jgi:hypothetical protein
MGSNGHNKYKTRLNLNTTPITSYDKKQKYKDHKNFHYRGEIKIVGKETDTQECRECHEIFPAIAFHTKSLRSDGAYYLKKMCRQCNTRLTRERWVVRKNAPPKPDACDCCHKKNKKLEIDHIHGTFIFRGWVCTDCNSGGGRLGDTLEGVLQAAVYFEKDKSKIIEKLNEME